MKHHSLLVALLSFLAMASPALKGEETLQPASTTLADTRLSSAFYPTDSWPELSDFKTVLKLHTPDFSEILPHFVDDSFYELSDSKAAMSDHYVTWGEITDFLNNVAWRTGNDVRHLYTGTLAQTITRKLGTIKREGDVFSESYYTYEVSQEVASQPALLSLANLQRYVNWRESHYWRYGRLLDQEKGITDPEDAIVSYFENHLLWPMIKLDENIDNLYDVVEKSTEVGTFCFSEEGNRVTKIDPQASYRLVTQEEISSWRGTQLSGKVWGIVSATATDPAECSAFDTATGQQTETSQDEAQECYGILALNTEKMKNDPDFQKNEETLQRERAHFGEFLQQDLQNSYQAINGYYRERNSNNESILSNGSMILSGTELATGLKALYEGFRWWVLRSCTKSSELPVRGAAFFLWRNERRALATHEKAAGRLNIEAMNKKTDQELLESKGQENIHLYIKDRIGNGYLDEARKKAGLDSIGWGIVTAALHYLGNSYNSSY